MSPSSLKSQPQSQTSLYKDCNLQVILCVTLISIIPIFSINPTLAIISKALAISSQQIGLVLLKLKLPPQAIKINDVELKTYVEHIGRSVNNREIIGLLSSSAKLNSQE